LARERAAQVVDHAASVLDSTVTSSPGSSSRRKGLGVRSTPSPRRCSRGGSERLVLHPPSSTVPGDAETCHHPGLKVRILRGAQLRTLPGHYRHARTRTVPSVRGAGFRPAAQAGACALHDGAVVRVGVERAEDTRNTRRVAAESCPRRPPSVRPSALAEVFVLTAIREWSGLWYSHILLC
jgi:hypothetical protein